MSSKIDLFQQSWLNTIFDGRNKSYGAYELRQTNPKTTLIALFFGALFFTGAIAIPVIKDLISELASANDEEVIREVKLDKINKPKEEKKEEILEEKKPEEQKKTQTVQDIQKFVPPVVVDKQEVKEELATIEELKDKNVGNQTMAGNPDGDLVMDNSASEEKSNNEELIDHNKIFTAAEVMPAPANGIDSFRKKVQNGLIDDIGDIDESINGIVKIRFVVLEDGTLDSFQILEENPKGYRLAEKAIKQIKKSPKWIPGMNNGRNVKVYFTFPLKFNISAPE
jgi:protein TonB